MSSIVVGNCIDVIAVCHLKKHTTRSKYIHNYTIDREQIDEILYTPFFVRFLKKARQTQNVHIYLSPHHTLKKKKEYVLFGTMILEKGFNVPFFKQRVTSEAEIEKLAQLEEIEDEKEDSDLVFKEEELIKDQEKDIIDHPVDLNNLNENNNVQESTLQTTLQNTLLFNKNILERHFEKFEGNIDQEFYNKYFSITNTKEKVKFLKNAIKERRQKLLHLSTTTAININNNHNNNNHTISSDSETYGNQSSSPTSPTTLPTTKKLSLRKRLKEKGSRLLNRNLMTSNVSTMSLGGGSDSDYTDEEIPEMLRISSSPNFSTPPSPTTSSSLYNNKKRSDKLKEKILQSIHDELLYPHEWFIPAKEQRDEMQQILYEFYEKGETKLDIIFQVEGIEKVQQAVGGLYLWNSHDKIVISDIDGTITKSDVGGHVAQKIGKNYVHPNICSTYSKIHNNGYKFLYLTARPITMVSHTRYFIENLKEVNSFTKSVYSLPPGPVITAYNSGTNALLREVILKRPDTFKVYILDVVLKVFCPALIYASNDVKQELTDYLSKERDGPFFAGFGNRETDDCTMEQMYVNAKRIFRINTAGKIVANNNHDRFQGYLDFSHHLDTFFPKRQVLL
ncbi:hypothetical protein ABK040_007151 [Willaertia magna]